jgi:hypothetical protein
MSKTKEKIYHYQTRKCHLRRHEYQNGRPALQLVEARGGHPFATLTTNLPNAPCPPGHTFVKDWSENEGALQFLVDNGLVEDTGSRVQAGFTQAPLVKLL